MSLRKIWLLILIVVSVTAISANTIILTFLTDRYFSDYLNESYELHVGQLTDYTTKALSSEEISYSQMAIELESHINDPIIEIKLYDPSGQLIIDVGGENYMTSSMMNNMMRGRMMDQVMDLSSQETRQIEISSDNQTLGIINITIHSLAENSFIARRFKSALLINSMFAIGIAIIAAVIIGMIISRKMSKSLKETEKLASDIQLGKEVKLFPSGIKEVNGIRESLMELHARLRMKQTTRKSLIDQLVHQTRTPLTILQTHLEAIEDGIIEANTNELNVCQNQIKDIKSIISNMSSMIDAGSDIDELKIERFELYPLLRQIQQGLMAQFKKKQIQLELLSDEKIWMKTDKYKLSQSIYNIVTNAYKYTGEGGIVRISYILSNGMLIIKIQDTGIGIAHHEADKVFDAYYRSSITSNIQGNGLGLYIVKENIESIKGKVMLQSQLDVGTTFSIELPQEILKK